VCFEEKLPFLTCAVSHAARKKPEHHLHACCVHMKLPDLYRSVGLALSQDHPSAELERYVERAHELSALTGWAFGPIDPRHHFSDLSSRLEETLRTRYGQTQDPVLAKLHDALVELRATITRHDKDLSPCADDEDDVYVD
jgi:hypothetical protein